MTVRVYRPIFGRHAALAFTRNLINYGPLDKKRLVLDNLHVPPPGLRDRPTEHGMAGRRHDLVPRDLMDGCTLRVAMRYRLGAYLSTTAPELSTRRSRSFNSTYRERPANKVGP